MANDVKIVLTAQDKASEGVNRITGRIEALEKSSSAVAARMDTIRNALAGVVTVGAGLALSKQFIDMADSMALLQSRVKLATSDAAEFAKVQTDLFALAQRNSVSLEEVAGAFSRLSDPVKRLGGGSKEAIGIIESLSKSLKISGASAQESASAIQQFSQAMGSGKLQGDEFKSLAEAAPRFMKALSEGSGIAAEKLKDMASEGKLTADVVGNALLKSLGKLNTEAAQMPDTVGQAMTRLKNEVAKAVDEINQAGGINTAMAGMVGDTAALIAPIKQEMIEAFQAVGEWIDRNRSDLEGLFGTLKALAGDVWRMAKAFAGINEYVFEAVGGIGTVKTALESVRLIVAGIEDGFTAIGAALVKVGAWLIDRLAQPLADIMESYGRFLDMIGSSSADWFKQTSQSIRATTESAHQYSSTVYKAFADGQTAVMRLNAELASTEKSQAAVASAAKKAGDSLTGQAKAAAAAAAAFDPLKNKNPKADDAKKPSGADPYQQLLDSLRKRVHATEQLNELEKLNIELQEKKYARLSPLQKANLQALAMQIDASRLAARYAKQDAEDEAKRVSAAQRSGQAMADETQAIWDKIEAEVEAAAVIGKSRSEIEARTLALMQEQLEWRKALGLQDEQTEHLEDQIRLQRQLVSAARNTESTQARSDAGKAAVEAARQAAAAEWQKTVDRIDQTFHDGFVGMLEKGKADWESFADSLATTFKSAVADEIYKMTLKPLVLNVVGSFSGAGAGTAGSGATGVMGVVSNVSNAYNGISSGITNAASSFATSGMGQYIGLSTTAAMGPPTAAGVMGGPATVMTGSGSTLSAVAAPATAALIGTYLMAEMAKAGWGMDNNRSAGGAYASNPYLYTAYQAGSRLFGRNRNISTDAGGIQGVFDTSGFTGDRWQQFSQRGGTFRSDKRWTDTFELDSDIDSYLDSLMRQTVSQLQAIGKTLDVETVRAVEGFSHQFSLQLSENGSWEKAGEKIAGEMAKVSDELVKSLVPGLADLSLFGETATQTFTRLGQEVAATDAILLAMGKNAAEAFGGVGLASIAARENLIDLAGGLESLASKTQSFYANFYTGEEQLNLAAKQAQRVLDQGFADLDLTQPTDSKGFRELVESYGKDLSTEGARKYFNALLDLEDEYNIVAKAAESASDKLKVSAEKLAAASDVARQSQGSIFDTFASDAQKLDAARKIVSDTFASIGKAVPDSAGAFLSLAQSIDPATEAGQGLIATLAKVSNAFAYTQTVARATLTGQMSEIESRMADLAARFGSLSPAARTVADDLAATQQQLAGLSDGLANLFNTAQLTDLQKLGQTVGYRDQIRGAISQINDDVFEAMLKGIDRPQQIEQLKKAEADLWAGMSVVADKGQQAAKIRAVVLRRLGLESDEANSAAGKAADLAKQARQDQIDTLRTQIDGMQRMRDLAGQIADFTDNLSIGDLSPLSYADQLASAKSLFEQTLAAAQIGDTQAQSQLTGNARTYLDEARRYFASSTDYAAIYEKVTGSLKGFAAPSDSALTAAQAQLDTLSKLPDVMAAVVDNSKNDVAALQAVQLALRNGDDYLSKSIDAQTVALQKQIDALTTIASNQEAQIRQAGTAYQQMTDELKAVKAQLAAIEANGALAGAA